MTKSELGEENIDLAPDWSLMPVALPFDDWECCVDDKSTSFFRSSNTRVKLKLKLKLKFDHCWLIIPMGRYCGSWFSLHQCIYLVLLWRSFPRFLVNWDEVSLYLLSLLAIFLYYY